MLSHTTSAAPLSALDAETRNALSTLLALPIAPLRTSATPEEFDHMEALIREAEAVEGVVDLQTGNHHADDNRIYGRSIVLPANKVTLGGTHRQGSLSIVVGDITVLTETGFKRLTGIHVVSALAGHKRIGFTHAETFWLCVSINPTGGADVAAIEDVLCVESERLQSRRTPHAMLADEADDRITHVEAAQ